MIRWDALAFMVLGAVLMWVVTQRPDRPGSWSPAPGIAAAIMGDAR